MPRHVAFETGTRHETFEIETLSRLHHCFSFYISSVA